MFVAFEKHLTTVILPLKKNNSSFAVKITEWVVEIAIIF